PALLADRIPVLLGGHRYRPDAAADTDAGQGRDGVRVTASARVLRRDADEHQERAGGELLQIAAAVLAQRPARRSTAGRRNRLGRRRSPAGRGDDRAIRAMDPQRPANRQAARPGRRPRRRRGAGRLQRDARRTRQAGAALTVTDDDGYFDEEVAAGYDAA